jgi:hypothetical protein
MQLTDSLTKGFLTGRGTFYPGIQIEGTSRWSDYQDPTYLGFYFKFNTNTVYDPNNQDLDYLPQGLFLGAKTPGIEKAGSNPGETVSNEHPDSAVSFLQRRGEYYRAGMMKEFREGMIYLTEKEPWAFEKISGLADLWKIEPAKYQRAKDKKITFELNDTLNLRITYLADLYRKAAFDAEYMRYMLPETQRYFSMSVVVTDIRTLQSGGLIFEPSTFLQFDLDYCEFDFFNEGAPQYLGDLNTYAGSDGGKVKFVIKVGRIREANSYGLLGAVLNDTFDVQMRGRDAALKSFAQGTTIQDATGENLSRAKSKVLGFKNTEHARVNTIIENSTRIMNSTNALGNTPRADRFQSEILNNLATGALAKLESIASRIINKALLGNVYGFSPANLLGSLEALQNDPFNTIASVVSNVSLPSDTPNLAKNVGLTGVESKLLEDFIGAVSDVQDVVAGTSLESSSIGDLIKGINASQNLSGSLGNVNLTSSGDPAPISPIKQERTGIGTLDGLLSKVLLEGSGSIEGSPSKTELEAPPKEEGSGGKVNLEGPTIQPLSEEAVKLDGPFPPVASYAKEELSGPPISLQGNLSSTDLEDNGANLEGGPATANLEGGPSTLGDEIKASTDISKTDPSQNLEGSIPVVPISAEPSEKLEGAGGSVGIIETPSQNLLDDPGSFDIIETPSQNLEGPLNSDGFEEEASQNLTGGLGKANLGPIGPSEDLEGDLGNVNLE